MLFAGARAKLSRRSVGDWGGRACLRIFPFVANLWGGRSLRADRGRMGDRVRRGDLELSLPFSGRFVGRDSDSIYSVDRDWTGGRDQKDGQG